MAVRIRTRFHAGGRERSMSERAGVVAATAWKLAQATLKNMRDAGFDIDIGQPYFAFVSEYLVFQAQTADRIAHAGLTEGEREEFTTALALRLADLVEDNRDMLLGAAQPGDCRTVFIERFNRRGGDYAQCDFAEGEEFDFLRCLAAGIRDIVPSKDRAWVVDQVMSIEAPETIDNLRRLMQGLLKPASDETQGRGRSFSGD